MGIVIESLLDGAHGAHKPAGSVAVIDVLRTLTTAAVALDNRASHITMVSTVEEAFVLHDSGDADACMGEVRGRAPPGFDFGNSPAEIAVNGSTWSNPPA